MYGTTDWFRMEKGVWQGCLLSPCLFIWYADPIMWYPRLDELQAGIKITGRNINNLIYTDDTPLMAESKEELKNLLMRVKEESEKASLNLRIKKKQKNKKLRSWQPVSSLHAIEGEKVEVVTDLLFLVLKSLWMVTAAMKVEDDCFLAGKLWQT